MLNDDFLYQGAQNIFVFQLSLIYIDANSSLFSDKTAHFFGIKIDSIRSFGGGGGGGDDYKGRLLVILQG